jgi:hypothetical protein
VNVPIYLEYLKALNFKADDSVCVSFGKDGGWVGDYIQPFSSLSTEATITKLGIRNDAGQNIYFGMSVFKAGVRNRTKENVVATRHCWLDADEKGDEVLAAVTAEVNAGIIPEPAIAVGTSPGKVQIIWHLSDDGTKGEALNRALQFRYKTDAAVVDSARVLRAAGFINNKYLEKPEATIRHIGPLVEYRFEDFKIEAPPSTFKKSPSIDGDPIPRGDHDKELTRIAGKLREAGMEEGSMGPVLIEVCEKRCVDYGSDYKEMCEKIAHSVCRYAVGKDYTPLVKGKPAGSGRELSDKLLAEAGVLEQTQAAEDAANTIEVIDSKTPDMPAEAIVDGVLSEIHRKYFKNFPRAYAWPALLTVAGAMVPFTMSAEESIAISAGYSSQTNLYTALIGPVHSGKSQAIMHAVGNLALDKSRYTDVSAGSIEGLLKKLAKECRTGQMMVDLDEWSHFFKKAGIQHATFVDVLNKAFNKPTLHLTIAKGEEINLMCAVSLIGGIVWERIQDCFNAESTTGFHDRFLFGICPEVNPHVYFPFDVEDSAVTDLMIDRPPLARVKIDRSVWHLAAAWGREDLSLGRSVEVTVRCCVINASFNGQTEITDKDLTKWRPFMDYQKRCRELVVPMRGLTTDARMSNAILGWLKRHADGGEWVTQRSLKKGIHGMLEDLGPIVFKNTMNALVFMDAIQTKTQQNKGARPSDMVRLQKGM